MANKTALLNFELLHPFYRALNYHESDHDRNPEKFAFWV